MPFIMLANGINIGCWLYGSRGWNFPPITQCFGGLVTDSSWVAIWQNGSWHESVSEEVCCGKIAPMNIYWCFLNVCGAQTVDVRIVEWWIKCFNSGNSNMYDKPCSTHSMQTLVHQWLICISNTRDYLEKKHFWVENLRLFSLSLSVVVSVKEK